MRQKSLRKLIPFLVLSCWTHQQKTTNMVQTNTVASNNRMQAFLTFCNSPVENLVLNKISTEIHTTNLRGLGVWIWQSCFELLVYRLEVDLLCGHFEWWGRSSASVGPDVDNRKFLIVTYGCVEMIYWKLTWSWKMHEWLGSCCRRWRPRVRNNLHQKLMKLVQSPIKDPASTLRSQLRRGILMPMTRSLPAVLISTTPTAKFPSNTSMVCNLSTPTYDSSMQVTVVFFPSPYPCKFCIICWCFKFHQNSKPLFPSKVRRFCTCSKMRRFWSLTLFKPWWVLFVQSSVYSHGRKLRRKSTRRMSSWTTLRRTVGITTRRCWQLHRERSPTSKPTRRSFIPSICTNTKRFGSFWTAWVCVVTSILHHIF